MNEYVVMPKADYQDACDAVREMTGGTDSIKSGDMGAQVRSIQTGVELPELTNPAGENDVRDGMQYIGADGTRKYGRLYMDEVVTADWGAVCPVEVQYDSDDRWLVMTDMTKLGDAEPEDVAEGKTFTSKSGSFQTGTASGSSGVVGYCYLSFFQYTAFRLPIPEYGMTWREYVESEWCGIHGAFTDYNLIGEECVQIGTSPSGYPVYVNGVSPDDTIELDASYSALEFVP